MQAPLLLLYGHRSWIAGFAWLITLAWLWRILPALWMLPRIPNLLDPKYAERPDAAASPSVAVIVPAKNEAKAIEACLRSVLANDFPRLEVVAIDDRSTDSTGAKMDEVAAVADGRLRVMHVTELPAGWLGKPHAMARAAEKTESDWLLFTDADVLFAPDAIRRAMNYATQGHADHVVVFPSLILRGPAEKMLIAFFQNVSALAARPWKIADPAATRDYIGVGAFSLVRRSVYEALGGFQELRMEVLEDMRFGFRVKQYGFAQRVAFGKDLVRIRWADSAWGMLANLTKNLYAVFRFRAALLVGAWVGLFVMCMTPFLALLISGATRWAGMATLGTLVLLNLRYWRQTNISPVYLALLPVATLLFLFTMARSMALVLWRGGVLWRGTLYPLKDLRREAGPLW
jgi:cellulose synthase/poly-beta-1,6-N-acetylglucosamine synthase-like glycosyltransferase